LHGEFEKFTTEKLRDELREYVWGTKEVTATLFSDECTKRKLAHYIGIGFEFGSLKLFFILCCNLLRGTLNIKKNNRTIHGNFCVRNTPFKPKKEKQNGKVFKIFFLLFSFLQGFICGSIFTGNYFQNRRAGEFQ
jgi:hypothetical protein